MSFSRRNWSDLSSLARQRTLEDEEEQQRERRRRHRSLLSSSSVDEDHPSPGKDPSPAPSRSQAPVKPVAPEEGEERTLSQVLRTKEGRRLRSPMAVSEKLKQEKEQQEAGVKPHKEQESIAAAERDQDTAPAPAEEQHPEPAHERKVTVRGRLQDREGPGTGTPRGEQRREEEQQRVAPELGGCRLREVKILTRTRSSSTEEKAASEGTSPPAQQHPPRNPSKEGMQPPPSQEEPTGKPDASPAPATFSSSIRRSSPRTVSFRVISKKQKEENESPLARSASMRIPGSSSSSIEEKLEKYTSAVQRSGSVRSSLTVQKSLVLTSEGVASKRNFFEASVPSKAEPLAARKDNLKIPGSVTSRINLWISRTQEPAKEEKSKDIRKINSLPKRDVWVKQPRDTPADSEL
ncbi:ladinin-1 isoform X2 [Numida meleagris]|uniref:ladinin-1 isoform X2 n=1 Tax=Numida meleagris TaxID=8996 RepID=UPI000B3E33AA|nr:ladinin-1 isoform X2 [Numida meleagris]